MIERLHINANAQYFRVRKKLTKKLITACLKKAAENSIGRNSEIIRHELGINNKIFRVSCNVFKTERKPPFLFSGEERDIIYCYALLIETDDILIISKSGGQDFYKMIERSVKHIEATILQNAFIEETSQIEKIATQSIDTRKNLLKNVTYQDTNLQVSLPTFSLSQKVVKNIRHKTGDKRYSTITNKSKFNVLGQKGFLTDFCQTSLEAFSRFDSYKEKENFLSNFATLLPFSEHSSKLTPKEFLFITTDLIQLIEENENQLPKLYYQKPNGRKLYLRGTFLNIVDRYAELINIEIKKDQGTKISYLQNQFDKTLQLVVTDSKFKLKSKKFKNVFLEFEEHNSINLQQYINENQCYNLTFDKSDIRYSAGLLCQDSKLLGNISSFLQIFIPNKVLEKITSEKGTINKTSKNFSTTSLFHYTESNYSSDVDDLILDDLGYESSDYIGVKSKKKIQLFHCKYSKRIFSASAFQEVVGQALKNLNFFYQTSEIDKKAKLWTEKYADTKISRIRKGDRRKYIDNLKETILSANCDREVYLIINFISLKTLTEELNKLKNNKSSNRQTNQILWLLSSLKHSCDDRGIKIYITCKE